MLNEELKNYQDQIQLKESHHISSLDSIKQELLEQTKISQHFEEVSTNTSVTLTETKDQLTHLEN